MRTTRKKVAPAPAPRITRGQAHIASGQVQPTGRRELLNLKPEQVGAVFLHDAPRHSPMSSSHHHEELEVNLIARGWSEYVIEGRRIRFPTHSLMWLLPTQEHILIQHSDDVAMWVGVFRPATVRRFARDHSGPPADWLRSVPEISLWRVTPAETSRHLARLFSRAHEQTTPTRWHQAAMEHLLCECWWQFRRSQDLPVGDHLHPAVRRALRELHDQSRHEAVPDVDELAARCGVSRPWLSEIFHKQVGLSITDFRNRQRLRLLEQLVHDKPALDLTDAAYAAGFGSYTQCFRIMRQLTGLSPRQFVERLRSHG